MPEVPEIEARQHRQAVALDVPGVPRREKVRVRIAQAQLPRDCGDRLLQTSLCEGITDVGVGVPVVAEERRADLCEQPCLERRNLRVASRPAVLHIMHPE
jgi:hypothetical protein